MTTKLNLNLILFAFLLSTIVGCKRTGEIKNTVKTDEELYKIKYIELNQMPDSTYTINSKDSNSISFNKSLKNSSTIISIRTFEERKFSDEDKFILFAENYIENQMKSYEMKSLHFDVLGFKYTTCLKFDGTFRDSTNQDKNKEYLSHIGYLCLLPDNESKIAEIKVVHYSSEKRMPKNVIHEYQAIVEKLKFTKN